MSATEVMAEIKKLPAAEQKQVFLVLAEKLLPQCRANPRSWLGRKLSFEEACDVVFRENRELLSLLAK
jgi:hypothetical protein